MGVKYFLAAHWTRVANVRYVALMSRLVHKTIAGIKIEGFSVAGEESVIAAPEYNVCFDPGRAPRETIPIDNMCVTHGHMDHAAGLAYYFSQRDFVGIAPGRVIVHRDLAQAIQRLMDVWADIEGHYSPGQVYGVSPLEDVEIRRGLLVRPFAVNHALGSLGYTLIEVRHKLKGEFIGKSGPQLVALKKDGVQIVDRLEIPLLTVTGDTALGRWLDLEFVRRTRVLLVECTFFEDEHRHRARSGRHIHIDDLHEVLSAVPDARIVLTHLSRRTDIRWARKVVENIVQRGDYERISFLMERPPRQRDHRPKHGRREEDLGSPLDQ